MSKVLFKSDLRYKNAALLKFACTTPLTIKEAMRAKGFTEEEADNRTLQQRVRRVLQQLKGVPSVVRLQRDANSILSPITGDSAAKTATATIATSATATTATTTTATATTKPRQIRKSSNQMQVQRRNQQLVRKQRSAAHKKACIRWAEERAKPKNERQLSCRQIVDRVNNEYGVDLSVPTVLRYVREGKAGYSPQLNGPPPGGLPSGIFALLVDAVESFAQINQVNCEVLENATMALNSKLALTLDECTKSRRLINQILSRTKIDFTAKSIPSAEERRVRWTTYDNIKTWFGNWKRVLESEGFGYTDPDSEEFVIPEDQLRRIINLDETALSLDGTTQVRGGRPSAVIMDRRIPGVGNPANKSSISITLICGSSAFGEALPPHFQFPTKATPNRERFRLDIIKYLSQVRGTFGNRDEHGNLSERVWPCTIGLNEKGGMDSDEFQKYINTSIRPLYPDAEDKPGRRVMIKIDSGPGRCNPELLVSLRTSGFLLFPCVPNTTHVTQETDKCYGLFKSIYRKNLECLTKNRLQIGKRSIPQHLIGLLVFGGKDPDQPQYKYEDAFAKAFSKAKILGAWKKVGAAPFTGACLDSKHVRRNTKESSTASDSASDETSNKMACDLLTTAGYKGQYLRAKIKWVRSLETQLTVPNTRERIEALSKASSHGERFFATGGDHCTSDDAFKAAEIAIRKAEVEVLEKDKKLRLAAAAIEAKAIAIESELSSSSPAKKLNGSQLKVVLQYYGIQKRDINGKTVRTLRALYKDLKEKSAAPASFAEWTADDEAELLRLKEPEVALVDTALGRYQQNKLVEAKQLIQGLSEEEKKKILGPVVV